MNLLPAHSLYQTHYEIGVEDAEATLAWAPSGDAVFMNTVGCYTYPSIGDSESMFRLDPR